MHLTFLEKSKKMITSFVEKAQKIKVNDEVRMSEEDLMSTITNNCLWNYWTENRVAFDGMDGLAIRFDHLDPIVV